jgi:transposase
MTKKKRKKYTREFKEEAVKLVTEQGYHVSEAARNLGVHPNMLSRWKREILGDDESYSGTGNLNGVQAELQRLRKENKRLKMEREILKKAAAFFAKESD